MMTMYNIGDELYIKVTVKSITITDNSIKYTVKLPLMYVRDFNAELFECDLHHFDTEEDE